MTDLVCISPVDGREVARRAIASGAEIEGTLAVARVAQADWASVPLADRIMAIRRFLDALAAKNDEIVPELAWQMGRPIRYGGELRSLVERVEAMIEEAPVALAPYLPAAQNGYERYVERRPLGIVLVIAPWNYPFLTAANTIVPALLAGNAVILKHATQTLLVGDRFAEGFAAAGLPPGLFANLAMSHEDTAHILGAGLVDHATFTGSVEGGRAIERAAAGSFTTLTLELGGKDPAYVRSDADLAQAIETLAEGAFYNSGQCCCGIERIYIDRSVSKPFLDGVVAAASAYRLDDPLDQATTLGPMASARLAETVRDQTSQALARGARAHVDPAAFAQDRAGTAYLMPQVLTDVDHSMAVMREESFGPVVGLIAVDSDDEAVRLMNDSRYGLTASIWTRDRAAAARLGMRIEAGTIFMNRCDYVDPGLAWTGVKDTGRGASLGRFGFEAVTRPQSFHLRES